MVNICAVTITSMPVFSDAAREWCDHLRSERGASVHTVSNYQRDIDRYCENLEVQGIENFDDISAEIIEAHLAALRSGALTGRPAAASSVARAASSIRSFHRFCLREGLTAVDPSAQLVIPKQALRLPKALTINQVSALLAAAHASDDPVSIRDAALIEILYATGARISEAIELAMDDIDLDAELPVVRLFGKGRKERLVPIGSYAREALGAYLVRSRPILASRGGGAVTVFLNKRGAPLSRQSAWEAIGLYAKAAGIEEHVSPHTLRHSFATHLLEGGANVRDVQELLGHASVQTTQIYTKVTAQTLREVHRMAHPRAMDTAFSQDHALGLET